MEPNERILIFVLIAITIVAYWIMQRKMEKKNDKNIQKKRNGNER